MICKISHRSLLLLLFSATLFSCSDSNPIFNEITEGREEITAITITPDNLEITDSSEAKLAVTGIYLNGKTKNITEEVIWISSDTSIGTVIYNGIFQPNNLGSTLVTAQYQGFTSNQATVTVATPVVLPEELTAIELSPASLTVNESSSQKLTVYAIFKNGSRKDYTDKVTWTSSNAKVGIMLASGYFQARDTGSAIISASYQEFSSNEVTVTVSAFSSLFVDGAYSGLSDGSKLQPFVTIGDAIAHAKEIGARRINVAKGSYTETLIIDADMSLYGGYNPVYSGADWARDAIVVPADTLVQAKGTIAMQYKNGLSAATVLDGFRIIGSADATNTSSIALFVQQASPSIQNNEIYGGTCTGISIGILNQTASPTIKNNAIISGGLPKLNGQHTGGGSDNIAILSQSFSSPFIEGNGSAISPSQVITGPTGGENTFRIKCESSSNATIKNNTIEILTGEMNAGNTVKGILAISSSPVIEGNTITSTDNTRLAIRGENSSFQVKNGNSITGNIEIASNSVNPLLDGNSLIDGAITVTGSSTGVEIKNHFKPNPDSNHPQKFKKERIITTSINFDLSSSGLLNKNVSNRIIIQNQSSVTIQNSVIFTNDTSAISAIYIVSSQANIVRNYIESVNDSWHTAPISISSNRASIYINNNIIYSLCSKAGFVAFSIYLESFDYVHLSNNLLLSQQTNGGHAIGIEALDFNGFWSLSIYNNIIYTINGLSRKGIDNADVSENPNYLRNNYFYNVTSDLVYFHYEAGSPGPGYTVAELEPLNTNYSGNVESGIIPNWIDFDISCGTTRDMYDCNFNINTGSSFINKGKNPQDDAQGGSDIINTDYKGCLRKNITTDGFSVGPYEISSNRDCPQ